MNKKTQIAILIVMVVGLLLLIAKPKNSNIDPTVTDRSTTKDTSIKSSTQSAQPLPAADKIEVVHFHGTQQCWSCITVGEYALKTIKESFPEEYESGKIMFKDVNGELKENQFVVTKYQARGSSLFVNSIVGEKENIKEDVTVWRLINSESQFKTYFVDKLKGLLGK